jgi:hypothetical protein
MVYFRGIVALAFAAAIATSKMRKKEDFLLFEEEGGTGVMVGLFWTLFVCCCSKVK